METDHKEQLDEIYDKLASGDISTVEAIKQSNALTAEMTMAKAVAESNKRTQELLTDKDVDAAETQWHKDYPDYDEVVASGQLQSYIDKSPTLIDETIAYFQFKADQRFEEGKLEAEAPAFFKEDKTEKPLSDDDLLNFQLQTISKLKHTRPIRREHLSDDALLSAQMETLKKIRA